MNKDTSTQVDNQFLRDSKVIDFFIWAVETASWKFLAITTGVLSYALFDGFLQAHLPPQYLMWGRAVGILLIFLLVDAGLQNMVAYWFKTQAIGVEGKQNLFIKGVFWLIFFRYLLTATSSFWAAPATSKMITADNQANTYTNQIAGIDKQDSLELAQATTLLEQAKASENSRIEKAKKQSRSLFNKAYRSGDRFQRASYDREKFAWICNRVNTDTKDHRYCKRIKTAIEEGKALVLAEQLKVSDLETKITGRSNPVRDSMRMALAGLAKDANQYYFSTLSTNTNIIYLFDIAAALLGLFCTRLRVRRKLAAGVTQSKKNLLFLFGKAIEQWQQNWINWLEDLLNIDIDQDGTIGGASEPTTPPPPSTKTNENGRVVIAGFRKEAPNVQSDFSSEIASANRSLHPEAEPLEVQEIQNEPIKHETNQQLNPEPIIINQFTDLEPLKRNARNHWRRAHQKKKGENQFSRREKQLADDYRAKKLAEFKAVEEALKPYYRIEKVSNTSLRFHKLETNTKKQHTR